MYKALILICSLTFSLNSYAQHLSSELCGFADKSSCCSFNVDQNVTAISRLATRDQLACSMGVVLDQPGSRYRRFGFGSDGQVSVYIQVSAARGNNSTQSFLIYPFGENPSVHLSSERNFEVDSGSGQRWSIDSMTSLPVSLEDCTINVSSTFSLNNSGISISSCQKHLVVTTPVEVGGEYIAYKNKPLTIKDPKGKTCSITTSDLYNHQERGARNITKDGLDRYFNVTLKYRTNQELGNALKRLCPSLDVSMLVPARQPLRLNLDDLIPEDDAAED